jgi:hypothetical protein
MEGDESLGKKKEVPLCVYDLVDKLRAAVMALPRDGAEIHACADDVSVNRSKLRATQAMQSLMTVSSQFVGLARMDVAEQQKMVTHAHSFRPPSLRSLLSLLRDDREHAKTNTQAEYDVERSLDVIGTYSRKRSAAAMDHPLSRPVSVRLFEKTVRLSRMFTDIPGTDFVLLDKGSLPAHLEETYKDAHNSAIGELLVECYAYNEHVSFVFVFLNDGSVLHVGVDYICPDVGNPKDTKEAVGEFVSLALQRGDYALLESEFYAISGLSPEVFARIVQLHTSFVSPRISSLVPSGVMIAGSTPQYSFVLSPAGERGFCARLLCPLVVSKSHPLLQLIDSNNTLSFPSSAAATADGTPSGPTTAAARQLESAVEAMLRIHCRQPHRISLPQLSRTVVEDSWKFIGNSASPVPYVIIHRIPFELLDQFSLVLGALDRYAAFACLVASCFPSLLSEKASTTSTNAAAALKAKAVEVSIHFVNMSFALKWMLRVSQHTFPSELILKVVEPLGVQVQLNISPSSNSGSVSDKVTSTATRDVIQDAVTEQLQQWIADTKQPVSVPSLLTDIENRMYEFAVHGQWR